MTMPAATPTKTPIMIVAKAWVLANGP